MSAAATIAALADPRRSAIPGPVVVVVAHPDDETIGCGAQLARFEAAVLVMVTDGAPAKVPAPFATREDYRATRAAELRAALELAGGAVELVSLGIADQAAAFNIGPIADAVAEVVQRVQPSAILTHAYEGGHSDHDAVALAVHLAGGAPIIEMPYYRREGEAMVTGRFLPGGAETVVRLTPAEVELKHRMLAAHRSQAAMLAQFGTEEERFRVAEPDFAHPPHDPPLWFELFDWGLDGARFRELVREAIAARAAATARA